VQNVGACTPHAVLQDRGLWLDVGTLTLFARATTTPFVAPSRQSSFEASLARFLMAPDLKNLAQQLPPVGTMFASGRSRRLAALISGALVFVLFVAHIGHRGGLLSGVLTKKPEPPPAPPKPRFSLFGIGDLDGHVEIATVELKARHTAGNASLPLLQDLGVALPPFGRVRLESDGVELAQSDEAILSQIPRSAFATATVDVLPPRPTPDASNLLIGVATTVERLHTFLPSFRYWAGHTKAQILVVCEPEKADDEPKYRHSATIQLFADAGVELILVPSEMGFIDRYVSLIQVLSEHALPRHEWCGIIDDDTFFLDMRTALAMLAKYPAAEPYYVGAFSENKWNINEGGISAVGGAGVFLSRPLLADLNAHFDECIALPNVNGDGRLADCIMQFTPTKFTPEFGMSQLDLHGDVTGFYEAVRKQPVTVHHWRTWHHHEMPTVAAVSNVCGQPCVLQKYSFTDGWKLSNGFSIVKYGYPAQEAATYPEFAMEHTWKTTIWDIPTSWTFTLGPLKPRDEAKIQYIIEKADVDELTGEVTSYYVERKDGVGKGIIRVVWSLAATGSYDGYR
jgi:hypothetical protein